MNVLPPPGPERRRQLALLSVLIVVLVAYFGYQYWPTAGGSLASSNGGAQGTASKRETLPVPSMVNRSLLEAAPPGSDVGRNPFRFGQAPPPPAPTQPADIPPPPEPVKPPPPPPPQVPLQLLSLGKVTETNQRLINLTNPETGWNGWVREGDKIDGQYKLVKVNADNVIVAFLDGSGQKPLYIR